MNMKEKVLKGLKCLDQVEPMNSQEECRRSECPYFGTDCEISVIHDAHEFIADTPTIDAIPVDVLKKLAIKVCATENKIDQEILKDLISAIINAVIDAWQKEQEANHERENHA